MTLTSTMESMRVTTQGAGTDIVAARLEVYETVNGSDQLMLWERFDRGRQARLSLLHNEESPVSLQRLVRDGDVAYEALLGSLFRLVKKIVSESVGSLNPRGAVDRDDFLSEGYAALVEVVENFDPTKGTPLVTLVALVIKSRLRALRRGDLPESWERVLRSARRAEMTLGGQLGRTPTREELRDEVTAYCMKWAKEKLFEMGHREQGAQLEELARKKLIRQGTWAAIERLEEIRGIGTASTSLDVSYDGVSLLDVLGDGGHEEAGDVVAWFLSTLDSDDRRLLERRFALDGSKGATYEELADEVGCSWPEVRARVSALLGRLYAPHALFATLDEAITDRCEVVSSASRASDRLARRRIGASA